MHLFWLSKRAACWFGSIWIFSHLLTYTASYVHCPYRRHFQDCSCCPLHLAFHQMAVWKELVNHYYSYSFEGYKTGWNADAMRCGTGVRLECPRRVRVRLGMVKNVQYEWKMRWRVSWQTGEASPSETSYGRPMARVCVHVVLCEPVNLRGMLGSEALLMRGGETGPTLISVEKAEFCRLKHELVAIRRQSEP